MTTFFIHRKRVLERFQIEADDMLDAVNQARQLMIAEARTTDLRVVKLPRPEAYDWSQDARSERRYEFTEADAQDEAAQDRRLEGRLSDSEGIGP